MTARLHDEARRILFDEAGDLEAARAAVAKLTDATRRLLYAEIEGQLARGEISASPSRLVEARPASVATASELPTSTSAPTVELPYMEAKRLAEAAFERDYLARLMALAKDKVMVAARLAGVDRTNFRRLLQRNGLRPRGPKVPTKIEPAAKYTDRVMTILDENPHGLRTCEIAEKIDQAINFAFGILKSLERQGRVERHGNRYNTLWTLSGRQPIPRVETIPAAVVAVLSAVVGPMDARRLHDEIYALLRGAGKPPSKASLKRGISRLISTGALAYCGANEHGAMYVLAQRGDVIDLN